MSGFTRREFIKTAVVTTGALWLEVSYSSADDPVPNPDQINPWVRIDPDGGVVVRIDKSEMGQGVVVGLATLVAEELDVEWERIRTEFAPAAPVYKHTRYRIQATGGSTSITSSWDNLRRMGATARALLMTAAARRWNVALDECATQPGFVTHTSSGRRLAYGELVADAGRLPVPEVKLKDPARYQLIGKSLARPDTVAKVRGTAIYGIDVRRPGMKYATVIHAPVFGATLLNLHAEAALAMPGVRQVFDIGGAVAVVADNFWQARRGAEVVQCEWQGGASVGFNSEDLSTRWAAVAAQEGDVARDEGKAMAVLERHAIKHIDAVYTLPYEAHVTMEPMNCTADVRATRCDIWVPTQAQSLSQTLAAQICGLAREQVFVHTTYLGGGFGRRSEVDVVGEAVTISQRVGAPVQVLWTREEDIQHDFYRPASHHVLRAALNTEGMVEAWFHRLVCPPILHRVIAASTPALLPEWLPDSWQSALGWMGGRVMAMRADPTAVAGAKDLPYDIPNILVEHLDDDPGVPVGMWRSVGNSHNGFVVESFVDEIAHAQGRDPAQLRRILLHKQPRHLRVLDLLVEKAAWPQLRRPGIGRGMAVHEAFGSVVGQVAEVAVDGNNWRVTRVVCVIECGRAINPDNVVAQMEGGILFGLTAATKGGIRVRDGRVEQSNFHDYPIARLTDMPTIEVHIVASDDAPTGVGETGVPPIAAAVANALFDATRKRLRKLPFDLKHEA